MIYHTFVKHVLFNAYKYMKIPRKYKDIYKCIIASVKTGEPSSISSRVRYVHLSTYIYIFFFSLAIGEITG